MRLLPDEISTARLRLRGPRIGDATPIFDGYAQDPEVCRYMVWVPHASISVTQAFLASCATAWQEGQRLPYVIVARDADDAPLGMIEARLLGTTIDIGYVLARAHWGRALMPEAIAGLSAAALAKPGVFRVQATCDVENRPSQRALEKAGFTREGRLERYTVHPNLGPEPRPCFMYAVWR